MQSLFSPSTIELLSNSQLLQYYHITDHPCDFYYFLCRVSWIVFPSSGNNLYTTPRDSFWFYNFSQLPGQPEPNFNIFQSKLWHFVKLYDNPLLRKLTLFCVALSILWPFLTNFSCPFQLLIHIWVENNSTVPLSGGTYIYTNLSILLKG